MKMNVRKGSATVFFPIWHYEVEDLIVLKNNKGTEFNRARQLDYGVKLDKHFYKIALSKDPTYCLFSPSEVPGLHDAFCSNDRVRYEQLYEQYANDPNVRKKKVNALELLSNIQIERQATGRIYMMHIDNANKHTPFDTDVAPIRMSNLCMEIYLHTKPIPSPSEMDKGEIALCVLSAVNPVSYYQEGKLNHALLEQDCMGLVRMLDDLLDYQEYPVKTAEKPAKYRRSLGISTVNLAGWAASLKLRYDNPEFLEKLDEWMEALSYYCLSASVKLAKERGPCEWFNETRWKDGYLTHEHATDAAKALTKRQLTMDWDGLRNEIMIHGLRNTTLLTQAPTETSSAVVNGTNGIEPPRGLQSTKVSKSGSVKQIVPDVGELGGYYTTLWSMKDNDATLKISAVMQKYICQGISTNLNYDPKRFENGKVPVKTMIQDTLKAHQYGLKGLYYCNMRDGQTESFTEPVGCESGACAI